MRINSDHFIKLTLRTEKKAHFDDCRSGNKKRETHTTHFLILYSDAISHSCLDPLFTFSFVSYVPRHWVKKLGNSRVITVTQTEGGHGELRLLFLLQERGLDYASVEVSVFGVIQ